MAVKAHSVVGPILILCLLLALGLVAHDSGELGLSKLGLIVKWNASKRFRIILFGQYPYEEQWRAMTAGMILLLGFSIASNRHFWSPRRLSLVALVAQGTAVLLLSGGQVGLSYVGANEWGGLLLTLLIFTFTLSIGLPIAVLLAILRALVSPVFRGAIKIISEIIRSLPLAVVLLAFVLIIPYLCGAGASGLRLFSAALGLALYFAFYMSEVLVAGMTSVPTTQWDAARALGLSELLTVRLIVIPQALPISIPAATNELRIAIKETSILAIIGVMELTGSTRAAYEAGPASENFLGLYLVAGVMYATLLYGVILFGKSLEATFNIQRQLPDAAKIPSAIAEQVDRA